MKITIKHIIATIVLITTIVLIGMFVLPKTNQETEIEKHSKSLSSEQILSHISLITLYSVCLESEEHGYDELGYITLSFGYLGNGEIPEERYRKLYAIAYDKLVSVHNEDPPSFSSACQLIRPQFKDYQTKIQDIISKDV